MPKYTCTIQLHSAVIEIDTDEFDDDVKADVDMNDPTAVQDLVQDCLNDDPNYFGDIYIEVDSLKVELKK